MVSENFIQSIISRSNRNRLLLFAGILLIALIGGALAINAYRNLFSGPFVTEADAIAEIEDVEAVSDYYIRFEADDAIDTGWYEVSTRNGVETSRRYYGAFEVDRKYVLFETPSDPAETDLNVTGWLVPMPSDVRDEVLADIIRQEPRLEDDFLPFMIQTGDFNLNVGAGLAAVVVIALGAIIGLVITFQRMGNPAAHPILKNLARFGEPEQVSQQIMTEMDGQKETIGKFNLTRTWAVNLGKSSLDVAKVNDVVWMYKKVVNNRGLKSYFAHVYDRQGKLLTVPGKEAEVDQIMGAIYRRAPWVIAGFSGDIEKAWNKDRAAFIAQVDQRRQQTAQ